MSQYYEIVSFTCAYPNQIDKIIDILDPHQYIKHRLYRHHALTVLLTLLRDTASFTKIPSDWGEMFTS